MARNAEKNLCGLNRYVLAKRGEGKSTKKAVRPSIHSLTSAEEAKKWIPNIKKEIDYCLRQIECATRRNYSDQMVKEFEERVERLEREHWRFVHRVRELDPSTPGVPWQGREYAAKRAQTGGHRRLGAVESAGALTSALLGKQTQREEEGGGAVGGDSELGVEDASLSTGMVYHTITGTTVTYASSNQGLVISSNQGLVASSNQGLVTSSNQGLVSSVASGNQGLVTSSNQGLVSSVASGNDWRLNATITGSGSKQGLTRTITKPCNPLGLEYRSSSEEEEGV